MAQALLSSARKNCFQTQIAGQMQLFATEGRGLILGPLAGCPARSCSNSGPLFWDLAAIDSSHASICYASFCYRPENAALKGLQDNIRYAGVISLCLVTSCNQRSGISSHSQILCAHRGKGHWGDSPDLSHAQNCSLSNAGPNCNSEYKEHGQERPQQSR